RRGPALQVLQFADQLRVVENLDLPRGEEGLGLEIDCGVVEVLLLYIGTLDLERVKITRVADDREHVFDPVPGEHLDVNAASIAIAEDLRAAVAPRDPRSLLDGALEAHPPPARLLPAFHHDLSHSAVGAPTVGDHPSQCERIGTAARRVHG